MNSSRNNTLRKRSYDAAIIASVKILNKGEGVGINAIEKYIARQYGEGPDTKDIRIALAAAEACGQIKEKGNCYQYVQKKHRKSEDNSSSIKNLKVKEKEADKDKNKPKEKEGDKIKQKEAENKEGDKIKPKETENKGGDKIKPKEAEVTA